ncbi:MAG: SDR family NAD(P)-dependent oxidoreductase [Bacteroidetes bacterium]|nr:SDR family NAD(P)-dependent oxidoreductase [Bacteroidota bacterium]
MNFKDKVFVITGSTRGIGRELARQVLVAGGKVCLNGRNAESEAALRHYFSEYKDQIHFVAGNTSNKTEAVQLIQQAISHFGKIDFLITNAGMSGTGKFEESDISVFEEIINSNIYGSIFPVHAALSELKKNKGSILLISSLAALHGIPEYAAYSSGKMALTGFWQSLRKELHHSGIFLGIAYVGFTENDAEKRTYDTSGNLVQIQDRRRFKPATQEQTAKRILQQLMNKKTLSVHSRLGKFAYWMSRIFPTTTHRIFLRNYRKNKP